VGIVLDNMSELHYLSYFEEFNKTNFASQCLHRVEMVSLTQGHDVYFL